MSGSSQLRTLHFATVDVFTTKRFTGNPLAIIHLPDSSLLSQAEKQAIAGEFNLSETVFLHVGDSTNGRRLDIFTTTTELNFAGHPVIGTLSFIGQHLKDGTESKLPLKLFINAGTINASFDRSTGVAEAEVPHNFHIHKANIALPDVWDWQPGMKKWSEYTADDGVDHEHEMDYKLFPVVSVVNGMTFRLIRLPKIEGSLDALEPKMPSISAELDEGWSPSYVGNYFYVILPQVEAGVTKIRGRMIDPWIGEDPATGSAASALSSYLALRAGGRGMTSIFDIDQGVEMGRCSKIRVQVTLNETGKAVKQVFLSGTAVIVSQGTIQV